jgi:hypothetical protein
MKIAGKFPLCLGMPVMIRNNFATELVLQGARKVMYVDGSLH